MRYCATAAARVFTPSFSENTVKYHLKLIFEKLGVKTRAAAVAQYLNYAMA
ncbi:MAG: LuxR C-terminal-related transcriptional regulator [Pseudomonadota bacterium]